jgi:type IV secretory pathway VirB10-like protein
VNFPNRRSQEILAEGPTSNSIAPKTPPETSIDDKSSTPTPPSQQRDASPPANGQKSYAFSVPKGQPEIKSKALRPTSRDPVSFDAHFLPASSSMRTVESDSPAPPSGWGGWLKKKLQDFVGS